jgi:hypothetical protein
MQHSTFYRTGGAPLIFRSRVLTAFAEDRLGFKLELPPRGRSLTSRHDVSSSLLDEQVAGKSGCSRRNQVCDQAEHKTVRRSYCC